MPTFHAESQNGSFGVRQLITMIGEADDPDRIRRIMKEHGLSCLHRTCLYEHHGRHEDTPRLMMTSVLGFLALSGRVKMLEAAWDAGCDVQVSVPWSPDGCGVALHPMRNETMDGVIGHMAAYAHQHACMDAWLARGGDIRTIAIWHHRVYDTTASIGMMASMTDNDRAYDQWACAGGHHDERVSMSAIVREAIDMRSMRVLQAWRRHSGDTAINDKTMAMGHEIARHGWHDGLRWWLDEGGDPDMIHQGNTIGHVLVNPMSSREADDPHRIETISCLRTWCAATKNMHATSGGGWTVGTLSADTRKYPELECWVGSGGNLFINEASSEWAWLLDITSVNPQMVVTKAAYALMHHRPDRIPTGWREAIQDSGARALANAMIASFHDPMQMATWCHMLEGDMP
jgi:hypothetical protein